jgi:ParB/RepB/Spo0J family partition protein
MMTNVSTHIALADVLIGERRRGADLDKIRQIAASIGEIGLQHPITVRRQGDKFALIAGLHRVEACRLIGIDTIPAMVAPMDDVEARMWEIAENLHRAELTVQERSDQIAEWIGLSQQKRFSAQVAPKMERGRPESGINEASRDLGIERTEAQRAVKIATITPEAKEAAREAGIDDNQSKLLKIAAAAPEHQVETVHKLAAARSIMASRVEPDDSLDFFPTPPWATRALCELVLPELGIDPRSFSVWESACGEGHMSEPLREYFDRVYASDVYNYGQEDVYNFLTVIAGHPDADWIITNPPFGDLTVPFVLRAIELASEGVAMFVRSQWAVEGVDRYHRIFNPHPPTLMAFFSERVPLCKGRWDPDGSTATAYCWLVWRHGRGPLSPMWIPPGCRERLSKPDDRHRFANAASKPQELPCESVDAEARYRTEAVEARVGLSLGAQGTLVVGDTDGKEPSPIDDGLDIPALLRRKYVEAARG